MNNRCLHVVFIWHISVLVMALSHSKAFWLSSIVSIAGECEISCFEVWCMSVADIIQLFSCMFSLPITSCCGTVPYLHIFVYVYVCIVYVCMFVCVCALCSRVFWLGMDGIWYCAHIGKADLKQFDFETIWVMHSLLCSQSSIFEIFDCIACIYYNCLVGVIQIRECTSTFSICWPWHCSMLQPRMHNNWVNYNEILLYG